MLLLNYTNHVSSVGFVLRRRSYSRCFARSFARRLISTHVPNSFLRHSCKRSCTCLFVYFWSVSTLFRTPVFFCCVHCLNQQATRLEVVISTTPSARSSSLTRATLIACKPGCEVNVYTPGVYSCGCCTLFLNTLLISLRRDFLITEFFEGEVDGSGHLTPFFLFVRVAYIHDLYLRCTT